MYFIYGIYNTTNGKLYVGITNNLERRWYEHKKCGRRINKHSYTIHRAINKYGSDAFIYKEIDTADSLECANQKEMYWIEALRCCGYKLYNETDGGDGTKGSKSYVWTPEQRKAASERNSGEKNYFYGKQLFGEANGNYGKRMKPHVKDILLQYRAKLTPQQVQEIRDLYATGKYTQADLCRQFNMSCAQIHRIVRNKRWKSHGNKN